MSENNADSKDVANYTELEAKAQGSVLDNNDESFQTALLSSLELKQERKNDSRINDKTETENKNLDSVELEAKTMDSDLNDDDVFFQTALLSSIEFEERKDDCRKNMKIML